MKAALIEETESIKAARAALEEVNAAIRAYEAEKNRLETEAQLPGVKGLAAKNLLAQLLSSPLAERLSVALIKAEAAVRLATKQAQADQAAALAGKPTGGTMFWMNRELEERKRLYGRKN